MIDGIDGRLADMSRGPEEYRALHDILDAIGMIRLFTRGLSFEEFRDDLRTIVAVERELLSIGAAVGRFGDQAPSLCPEIPWRNLRGIEHWIRPQDDRLDVERVWITLIGDLPPLTASIGRVLSERPGATRKVTGPAAGL